MNSVFQVAEITRPPMSVSLICDQGMICVFGKDHARVLDADGKTVAQFERKGGLYTCTMKLRQPEARMGSSSARPERYLRQPPYDLRYRQPFLARAMGLSTVLDEPLTSK